MADNRTTTLYVVAYDIPSDKRRTKVHKILCGYGAWTQFSLFDAGFAAVKIDVAHDSELQLGGR